MQYCQTTYIHIIYRVPCRTGCRERQYPSRRFEYEVAIPHWRYSRSTSAVYVDEQNPTAKYNALSQSAHLRVGISPEFGGEMWTLISFSPIDESAGGPVPDDAVIRGAKLRLYKESGNAVPSRYTGSQIVSMRTPSPGIQSRANGLPQMRKEACTRSRRRQKRVGIM